MPRRMSCALTVDAVRERRKTVTRRNVDSWKNLRPGDRLTIVEKGMGLAKGERQVVLAEVEIVDVRVERLWDVTFDDVAAEGFDGWTRRAFIDFFVSTHPGIDEMTRIRRIEWRYLDSKDEQ